MPGLNLAVYNAVSELPSGAANGTMAWIAGSTNRLYISNGTAWYSTSAFSNVALSTYTLAGDYHHTALTKADLNWVVSNDYLNGISIDPNNNSIIIPGLETSTSGYKPAIWKLNNPSSGLPSLSWSSILTVNYGNDPMSASATDADGNIYYVYTGKTSDGTASGGIFAKVSPTGSLIWERLIYDSAYAVSNGDSRMLVETIQIDKENNIAVIGCRDNDLTASLIQKWDISQTTPSITWSRKLKYGTPLYSGQFHRAIIDNNGNIYTTGVSARRELDSGVPNPRQDVFVTKHSSDGTLQWQKHYCTSETPTIAVRGFATDSENNLILAGYGFVYDGGSQSDRDWLLKLDADGNILWQRHIGQDTDGTTTVDNTTRLGSVRNILVDEDDFIIVVGGSHRIGFFDPYGELIRSLEFSPIIGTDPGLILDNNNNLVIVSKIGAGSAPTTGDPYSSLGIYVLPSNSQLIQTGTYNDTGNSLGIDVVDLDLSTTPTVEVMVTELKADGGIILTASHNPVQWNALKLLNEKGEFISRFTGYLVVLLVLFGLSFIGYSYLFSFVFQKSSTAYRFFPFLNLIFFYFLPMIPFALSPGGVFAQYVMPMISPFVALSAFFNT